MPLVGVKPGTGLKLLLNSKKHNMENLINWGELSRILAGSRSVVTKNRMPKKYKQSVTDLIAALEKWDADRKTTHPRV